MEPYRDTQYVFAGDPESVKKGSSVGWIIGIIVFIILLVGIGLLIWWLVSGNNDVQKILSITGTNFTTPTTTSIQGTWTGVGNNNDIVNLYIFKSGSSVNFTPNGVPANSSDVVGRAGPVNGTTTKSLSVSTNIQTNVTYVPVLVVTNPDLPGFHNSVVGKALVPGSNVNGAMLIRAAGQSTGDIAYDINLNPLTLFTTSSPTVGYDTTGLLNADGNIFYQDPDGLICTVMQSQIAAVNNDSTTKCGDLGSSTYILYDPGVPTSGTAGPVALGIRLYQDSDTTNTNAQWKYDTTNQTWCLANNTARCLNLTTNATTINGLTPINITTPGSTWNNINKQS